MAETVARFARHFDRSPSRLGPEAIRDYQVYLTNERRLAPSSVVVAVSALRFLYRVTLRKQWVWGGMIGSSWNGIKAGVERLQAIPALALDRLEGIAEGLDRLEGIETAIDNVIASVERVEQQLPGFNERLVNLEGNR